MQITDWVLRVAAGLAVGLMCWGGIQLNRVQLLSQRIGTMNDTLFELRAELRDFNESRHIWQRRHEDSHERQANNR